MWKQAVVGSIFIFGVSTAFSGDQQEAVRILYPRDHSLVGNKVNLVLDPTAIPYFQVIVNKTEYPVVDTSTGAHAFQGLPLERGLNVITVKVLAAEGKNKFKTLASQSITVFNRDAAFSPAPTDFTRQNFHTRDHESTCGDCHRLEAGEQDRKPAKPEDVLCYTCHREIPKGKHIHGPAAVWDCLACHNPDLYPAKYAFSSVDPWKIVKSTRPAEPAVFTFSAAEFFKPASAVLTSRDKVDKALIEVVQSMKQNSGDRLRLEVHSDNVPLKPKKSKTGKIIGFKDSLSLTSARARALAQVLKASGIAPKRMLAVGMGPKLPKVPNTAPEGRETNNRIEIVVYPGDVKITNSQKLPVLKDRERVIVSAVYNQGPSLKKLRLVEHVVKGMQYVKGSGFFRGKPVDPQISGNELIWLLGDTDSGFSADLFYTVKKAGDSGDVPMETKIVYRERDRDLSREFDPKAPSEQASTVTAACVRCHADIVSKKFKHGPVDAGYCTLCHDPHASSNTAWLTKPVWDLCTTCHADKGSGVHVVAGFVTGNTHPTKNQRDPARPGKRLSCISCHNPHHADTRELLAYDVKTRPELCSICHKK